MIGYSRVPQAKSATVHTAADLLPSSSHFGSYAVARGEIEPPTSPELRSYGVTPNCLTPPISARGGPKALAGLGASYGRSARVGWIRDPPGEKSCGIGEQRLELASVFWGSAHSAIAFCRRWHCFDALAPEPADRVRFFAVAPTT